MDFKQKLKKYLNQSVVVNTASGKRTSEGVLREIGEDYLVIEYAVPLLTRLFKELPRIKLVTFNMENVVSVSHAYEPIR